MKLLLPLLAVGAYVVLHKPPAPKVVAVIPTGPQLIPSAPASIIQIAPGAVPGVKGPDAASQSPIEQAGYIPAPVKDAGPSAVALGRLAGCGCGGRCGGGLSGIPASRGALQQRLEAINGLYSPILRQAVAIKDRGSIRAASAAMGRELRGALADYHASNPGDRSTALTASVAPVFMGPSRLGV